MYYVQVHACVELNHVSFPALYSQLLFSYYMYTYPRLILLKQSSGPYLEKIVWGVRLMLLYSYEKAA